MKHVLKSWHALALMLLLASAMTIGMTSCGNDDEPGATTIDYYIRVDEAFLVNGYDRQTSFMNPVTRMKDAIRKVYPTPNAQGDDEAVIAACDKVYNDYVNLYEGDPRDENLTALLHLKKVNKRDGIIRENEYLKTYQFNINYHEEEN